MPEPATSAAISPAFEFLELTRFELTTSPHLTSWLDEQHISIALTNADHLFLIGLKPDGRLAVATTPFKNCIGLARSGIQTLYLVTDFQIWRLENALPPGQLTDQGCDALYLPQSAYTTGQLGIHDLAVDAHGQIIFVNTMLSCLSLVSETHNFVPLWQPSFIPNLAAVDYCHLNGLAMRDGFPAYVTSVSRDTTESGWREHKRDGGTVTEVMRNQVVLTGLSMPHSPRWYRDTLWLTHAGAGQFGRVDLQRGCFEPVTFAPGFLRGLDFSGRYAVVGSSKARRSEDFEGLPLQEILREKKLEAQLGLYIVDLETGEIVHWLRLEGIDQEIFQLVVLPGVRRPMAVEPDGDEIRDLVTIGAPEPLIA